ncbi:MAG: head GIN domain-containing protein [Nonlabens sp.]
MKNIAVITILMFSIQLCNAQWWGSNKKVTGNGEVITQEFKTGDYDKVSLKSSFDVELVQGKEGAIMVEAESNLMEFIEIEVKGNNLSIGMKDGVNMSTRKGVLVRVPVEEIKAINLAGSGDINGTFMLRSKRFQTAIAGSGDINVELECEYLDASIAGSGDMKLTGRTEQMAASVAGSGDISAYSFKANNVEATIAGSGDISVYCNGGNLKATIVGSGDLRYKGKTSKVKKTVMGSGDITKM